MFAITLVEKLAIALARATHQQNWQQVQQVNQDIAQLLTSQAGMPLSAPQQEALKQLKLAFQQAYECCGLKKQQLKAELAKMRHQQPAITAYAAMAVSAYQDMAQEEGLR
ncbi:hypothetical protein [Yersinia bercovieri]|uniref:hypothetical protein n=1 Tax=Yersinia bercovieri TaxID=634 RepID=UPI0005DA893A|nr:hypothetical protein [Yersinia bercovieri]CFQ41266.1 putative flagellar protein lafD [Yersinia bercovieri]CNF67186.1 putative flagellar protein lafD [Yersinia bercovieri]